MIGEKGKRHYVLIKDFNTFMYDHTLHRGKSVFAVIVCKLLVQTKEISKCHFKINGKQRILIPKKVNKLNSIIMKEKENHQYFSARR